MIITRIAKSLSLCNSKYELLPIVVTYKLGYIDKMGYNDANGKWVKIQGVQGEYDDDDDAPADALE